MKLIIGNVNLIDDPVQIESRLKTVLSYTFCKLKEEVLHDLLAQTFDFDKGLAGIKPGKEGNIMFLEKYHALVNKTIETMQ